MNAIFFSKTFMASLLIFNLFLAHHTVKGEDGSVGNIDCGGACNERCRLSSRKKMCLRACGTCCQRCQCVPPEPYGHEDVCPCYANMTTHGGRHKCP